MKALITVLGIMFGSACCADQAVVVDVKATQNGETWSFAVTISHGDEGWDHYADGWGVYTVDGTELGYRTLFHPHVNEQPFTRSLTGVSVPARTDQVIIKPRDLVHGVGADFTVDLSN